MNDHNLVTHPIQKGEVLNPNGRGKGTKNAMTIVREFMDKQIETLEGTKVSRFQCLLWHMYDIAKQLQKQADLYGEEYLKAKEEFEKLKDVGELDENSSTLKIYRKKQMKMERFRNKYEDMLERVQNAHTKLSEFFIKSSGQLIEKKEIDNKNTGAITVVSVTKADLDKAVSEINNEC